MKKEFKITILSILLTGLILSIAINLRAGAQQTTVNVITRIEIGVYTPRRGQPITRYFENKEADISSSNNLELYTVEINMTLGPSTAGPFRAITRGETIDVANWIARSDITITAKAGSVFDENVQIGYNGGSGQNNITHQSETQIILRRNDVINDTNRQPIIPPVPPTYHTVTIGGTVDPTPTPPPTEPPPTTDPPELPDLSEYSKVIIYAAELVIHAKQIQTADLKAAIEEQTDRIIESMQHDYQNNEELIIAIEEQTDQINTLMQRNFNMTIVFSLVTIGAIVGLGFLIEWKPTHD
jgi:hypothetical protein